MEFHVFDTYVRAGDGHTMHFDVVTDRKGNESAIRHAKKWLASIGEEGGPRDRRGVQILPPTNGSRRG